MAKDFYQDPWNELIENEHYQKFMTQGYSIALLHHGQIASPSRRQGDHPT